MTLISGADPVTASLDAFATIPDWLAAPMHGERVAASLRTHVPDLAEGRLELLSCAPERLRAKESEWVARFRLSVREPGGEPRDVVLVGLLWAPGAGVPDDTGTSPLGTFGTEAWSGWLPDLGLQLRHETSDEALPALPTLTEPGPATALLQPVLRDAGYAGATIATCDPVVVRYKPGSRCTVVVGLTYAAPQAPAAGGTPEPPGTVVLKTHQGDKGQTAWDAMTALWERDSWRGVLDLAEPLAFLPEERILVQGPVSEDRTLKELARMAFAEGTPELLGALRTALAQTGRALATLHRSGAHYGRTATFEDEVAEVREVIDRLAVTVPELSGAAGALLHRLEERAADHPADPIVPAHHDFRPAQVLLHGDGLGFIDFDGASMAEPALDLGRFRAKLRDIGISSLLWTGAPIAGRPLEDNLALLDDLCELFLASYLEHAEVSRERVALWETCDLLTGMLHAWTKVRLARLEPRLAILHHQLRSSGVTT